MSDKKKNPSPNQSPKQPIVSGMLADYFPGQHDRIFCFTPLRSDGHDQWGSLGTYPYIYAG